jgi:hypothetical protein
LDTVLDLIVSRLPEVIHPKACTIRLIESMKGQMELKATYGLSCSYLERGPQSDELATYFILKGEPVVIPESGGSDVGIKMVTVWNGMRKCGVNLKREIQR